MKSTTVFVKALNESVTFADDELPDVSNEFAYNYGLKQWINDGAAVDRKKFEGTDEEFAAARVAGARERIERLRAGDMPGTREPADGRTKVAKELVSTIGVESAKAMVEAKLTPEETARALAYINKQRERAGQSAHR